MEKDQAMHLSDSMQGWAIKLATGIWKDLWDYNIIVLQVFIYYVGNVVCDISGISKKATTKMPNGSYKCLAEALFILKRG